MEENQKLRKEISELKEEWKKWSFEGFCESAQANAKVMWEKLQVHSAELAQWVHENGSRVFRESKDYVMAIEYRKHFETSKETAIDFTSRAKKLLNHYQSIFWDTYKSVSKDFNKHWSKYSSLAYEKLKVLPGDAWKWIETNKHMQNLVDSLRPHFKEVYKAIPNAEQYGSEQEILRIVVLAFFSFIAIITQYLVCRLLGCCRFCPTCWCCKKRLSKTAKVIHQKRNQKMKEKRKM